MPPREVDGRDDGQKARSGPRCKGVKADGSPCGAPSKLVNPETGYCPSHGPDASEKLSEYGRKGGETTARRHHGKGGLTTDDLPPLVDHEAAEVWIDAIGRAVLTDSTSAARANAGLRAVQTAISNWEQGKVSDRVEKMLDAVAEWKRTGSTDPMLELVEGGE